MRHRPLGNTMQDARPGGTNQFSSSGSQSGAGSCGRLALFKAAFVNAFVALNGVTDVIEFGCGDGDQLSQLSFPHYTGVDVSPAILDDCRTRFPDRAFVGPDGLGNLSPADLTLSMDVIPHLPEDAVFEGYMRALFGLATNYVIIYSSDCEGCPPDQHIRHRAVSSYVRWAFPGWPLLARVPNIYAFDPRCPHDTSFADFMVFGHGHRDCVLRIPAATLPM